MGPHRHVIDVGPDGGTAPPRPRCGTRWWDHSATSSSMIQLPWSLQIKKICIFLSQKAECSSGKAPINLAAGCGFEAHSVSYFFAKKWRGKATGPAGPMSSRWYTSQTINDDLVLLLYDDYFVFVIILRAKAPSLVTNDEPAHFVIECSHSVTKLVIVTSESSLMNTFLVVN